MQGVGALLRKNSTLQIPCLGNVLHLDVDTGTPAGERVALGRGRVREEGLWFPLRTAESGLTFGSVIPWLSLFHWGQGRKPF